MKKISLSILFAFLIFNLNAQTNHTVNTVGMTFSPSNLTINLNDTVTFINTAGFHNVNGTTGTFPSNPASFSNPSGVSSGWTYTYVFTLAGTYDYQCDPHLPGMTGIIIVNSISVPGCTDSLAFNYNPLATNSNGSCNYCIDSTLINPNCICPMIYAPVCGCDGVIYSNSCLATCAGVVSYTPALVNGQLTPCNPTQVVFGCTDSTANNYNPIATVDDTSCIYTVCSLALSGTVINEFPAGANNGQIDLTVVGGTPCVTSAQVGSGAVSSYQSYLWYTYYMDGHTQITYPAAELASLGINAGDVYNMDFK